MKHMLTLFSHVPPIIGATGPLPPNHPDDAGSAVVDRLVQKLDPPKLHQVVLLNDDYTPMEFVVLVIQKFFNKDRETATNIMLKIHYEGRGVCGVFTKDIAATKTDLVLEAAHQAGHPLQCIHEPIE